MISSKGPSHLDAWYEAEEGRNPGWTDTPRQPAKKKPALPKSPIRILWDGLAEELRLFDGSYAVSGAELRNYDFAGRSVFMPKQSIKAPPHERMMGHIARCKTTSELWQHVSFAWLAPQIRESQPMVLMLAELVKRCPQQISLVAFPQHGWFAVALVANGFKAISPQDKMLPEGLSVPQHCACYVLRR